MSELLIKVGQQRERWYREWLSGDLEDYCLRTKRGRENFHRYVYWSDKYRVLDKQARKAGRAEGGQA